MINAKEAKEIALKQYVYNSLEEIDRKIREACKKGVFSIDLEGYLDQEIQQALKEQGYDVRVFFESYSKYTVISWD